MRLNIPLVPIAIAIERRPLGPFRPRATVRGLMLVVLGLALYLGFVTLPAPRERHARADRAIREHMALLARTAAEDREWERSLRTRHAKDVACAEAEEEEAAKFPPGSDDARSHREIAALWLDAARKVPLATADFAGQRAQALEQWIKSLEESRRREEASLPRLEAFARRIRELPWKPVNLWGEIDQRINQVAAKVQAESKDKRIRNVLASEPPVYGPGAGNR